MGFMRSQENKTEHRRMSVPFDVTRAESDTSSDGLTMEGYAAVFDTPTLIDSWEGRFEEQIAPGAFAKTIRESSPVLQFDHGQHPLLGSIPLGSIQSLEEDKRGLFVRARISDNWLTQPIRDAISDGAIEGMSFRFIPIKDEWEGLEDETPTRTLKEVRLLELGPVVFPAYEATEVSLRNAAEQGDREQIARALLFGQKQEPAEVTLVEEEAEPVVATLHDRKHEIERAMRQIDLDNLNRRINNA